MAESPRTLRVRAVSPAWPFVLDDRATADLSSRLSLCFLYRRPGRNTIPPAGPEASGSVVVASLLAVLGIAAAMTFHAVLEVADAFFQMLLADAGA